MALPCVVYASSYNNSDFINQDATVGFPLRISPLRVPTKSPPQPKLYQEILEQNHSKNKVVEDDGNPKRPECVPPLNLPDIEKGCS